MHNELENSKRYMRLRKNTPRVANAMTNPEIPSPATRTSHRATTTHVRVAPLSVHVVTRGRLPNHHQPGHSKPMDVQNGKTFLQTGTFSTQGS
jgi:hypothetical protein